MKTKIGGQAVLEGVMMRGATSMALAVRDELGQIRLDTTRLSTKAPWYKKIPFLRGVINLVTSMVAGTKTIEKSAEILAEDEVGADDGGFGGLMAISLLLGLVLAIGLFVWLPTRLTDLIVYLCSLQSIQWLRALLEGVIKIAVVIGYMASISCMKEIKRVFMYHGAEHKTIACYEAELPLTVENVQKCSRYHDRCGTSFLVFVVVLSVILMVALDVIFEACGVTLFQSGLWRVLLKIAMLPLTAGVSYEVLMLLAKSNFVLFRPLKWLGKQFQKLTTREPDDGMCEVAITAFNKVLEMDADQTVAEQHFPEPISLEEYTQIVADSDFAKLAGTTDYKWLTSVVLKLDEHKDNGKVKVPYGWVLRLQHYADRLQQGEPFAYVVESTEFWQRRFALNKDVLIPRQETELVCEQFIKLVNSKSKVLDLCCGSGVLGVTTQLQTGAKVTCADISAKALVVAKYNAKLNKAKVKFVKTDMFNKLNGKFDAIVCNPPYVESAVIDTLDASVKDYEPHLALDGGSDGLNFYRNLATNAPKYLNKHGVMVLEIGYNQGEAVAELLQDNFDVQVIKDYGGNDRIVIAHLH